MSTLSAYLYQHTDIVANSCCDEWKNTMTSTLETWRDRNTLELFGKPVLVIQLSPVHVLCPLLLLDMLLFNNLIAAHAHAS